MVHIGICLQLLVYDLSQGVRLQCSKEYPASIANLLRKCFEENPKLRPDFCEIKKYIEAGFQSLRKTKPREPSIDSTKTGSEFVSDCQNYVSMLSLNDFDEDSMKKNYKLIQEENMHKRREKNNIEKTQSVLKYASLDFETEMRPKNVGVQQNNVQKQSLQLPNLSTRFYSFPAKFIEGPPQDIHNSHFSRSLKQ